MHLTVASVNRLQVKFRQIGLLATVVLSELLPPLWARPVTRMTASALATRPVGHSLSMLEVLEVRHTEEIDVNARTARQPSAPPPPPFTLVALPPKLAELRKGLEEAFKVSQDARENLVASQKRQRSLKASHMSVACVQATVAAASSSSSSSSSSWSPAAPPAGMPVPNAPRLSLSKTCGFLLFYVCCRVARVPFFP